MPLTELNQRIDTLVSKLDELVEEVGKQRAEMQTQGQLREQLSHKVEHQAKIMTRVTAVVGAVIMFLAVFVLAIALKQSHDTRELAKKRAAADKHAVCLSQNNTRQVVRNLLLSAQDALKASKPPVGLTHSELKRYNQQLADAKVFYTNQLARVQPLKC